MRTSLATPLEPGPAELTAFAAVVRRTLGLGGLVRRRDAVERRLDATMARAGLVDGSRRSFVQRLEAAPPGSPLHAALADAVPNHESYFLRDAEQLQALVAELSRRPAPPRILSAGCARGEEVYSLAGLLDPVLSAGAEVWGIDVSPAAIAAAQQGQFRGAALIRAERSVAGWPARFFEGAPLEAGGAASVRPRLKAMTRFVTANLLDAEALGRLGTFDAVLCRNVLLHFDAEPAERAGRSLARLLRPGGIFVLGRTEAPPLAWRPLGDRAMGLYAAEVAS